MVNSEVAAAVVDNTSEVKSLLLAEVKSEVNLLDNSTDEVT